MSQKILNKVNEIYKFITTKNKEAVSQGKLLLPICYAIILDKKGKVSMLDIPLDKYIAEDIPRILKEMGKVLKENQSRVKMFMYTTQAVIKGKKNGEKEKDCLIFSSRDCYNNENYQILEIIKGEKNTFKSILNRTCNKWDESKKKKPVGDTLLDTIWFEYKNAK